MPEIPICKGFVCIEFVTASMQYVVSAWALEKLTVSAEDVNPDNPLIPLPEISENVDAAVYWIFAQATRDKPGMRPL